ncbi:MAG: trimethylamine methyltransferase family protein [Victivallaceae bacterium]|nr:trimethylamine methyltransferase family protein [Victivallaceae bacterium]
MNKVFKDSDLDILSAKVRNVLKNIGYQVDNEVMTEILLKKGLKLSTKNRIIFNDAIIDEFTAFQKERYLNIKPACGIAPIPETKIDFKAGFGNIAPKFYDYQQEKHCVATKKDFEDIVKFGHQESKIGSMNVPLSITDIAIPTAPIESFLILAGLTDKYSCSVEPFDGFVVKYLAELSNIFLGPGREKDFIDPCNCINPIMRLENRTASVMLERAKYNMKSMITSMPTAGGNAPITIDGSVIQGTAEIVGGLIISYLINPEAELMGYISSSVLDMKTINTSQSAPESVLIDVGVVNLMEHAFGGNTKIGGTSYVAATQPGLKAVYEKMFKASAYERFSGCFSYGGGGVIDNGALFSPEQLIIDMDITESFTAIRQIQLDDAPVEDIIAEVIDAGSSDFLSHSHTLENFRNAFWEPEMFMRNFDVVSEKDILDRANAKYRERVDSYSGYEYDKEKIKAGEEILSRAKKEAGI